MTREEEKNKARFEYVSKRLANPDYPTYNDEYELECAYDAGAMWTDAHPHWISVEDELPPIGGIVLVAIPFGGELSVLPLSIKNERDIECLSGMTHWMPLPQPPKEGGKE